jgi:NTP pyrophosphatase (non-canonical NTP hydrolase)
VILVVVDVSWNRRMDIYQDALNGIKDFVSKDKCCNPDEMLLFKILQELIDSQNDNKKKIDELENDVNYYRRKIIQGQNTVDKILYNNKNNTDTKLELNSELIFRKSIEIYGKEAQSRQAMEECAELIQAINKCLRYSNKVECKNNLIEEIADVEIMIFQLKEIFSIKNEAVESCKILKAKRAKKRLEEVKK